MRLHFNALDLPDSCPPVIPYDAYDAYNAPPMPLNSATKAYLFPNKSSSHVIQLNLQLIRHQFLQSPQYFPPELLQVD